MKTFILGIALFIGGIVGYVGWFIACGFTIEPLVSDCVYSALSVEEWTTAFVFAMLALSGLLLCIIECLKDYSNARKERAKKSQEQGNANIQSTS